MQTAYARGGAGGGGGSQASKFILPNCKNNSETGYQKTRRSSMLVTQ